MRRRRRRSRSQEEEEPHTLASSMEAKRQLDAWSVPVPRWANTSGGVFRPYAVDGVRVRDGEGKLVRIDPPPDPGARRYRMLTRAAWDTPSSYFPLGTSQFNCAGAADRLPNCSAMVAAVGCTALTETAAVQDYCPASCCAALPPTAPMTPMLELGFGFPYFDRSVSAVRVTHTGLVHLTSDSWRSFAFTGADRGAIPLVPIT